MGILSDDSRSVFEIGEEELAKQQEEAKTTSSILSIDDAEVDHILPYSKGGDTVLENAQLLHRHCNRAKNNSEIETVDWEDEE